MPRQDSTSPERDADVPVQRVGGSGTLPVAAAVLVAIGVAIALVKPWGAGPASSVGPSAGAVSTIARPVPTRAPASIASTTEITPDPDIEAVRRRRLCQGHLAWEIVTMERTARRQTRTVYGLEVVEAPGPASNLIPYQRGFAEQLVGLGICAPRDPSASFEQLLSRVRVWQAPGGRAPVQLSGLTPLDADLYALGEAYFGPPGRIRATPAWPAGRYIFQIQPAGSGESSLWFGLDYVKTER